MQYRELTNEDLKTIIRDIEQAVHWQAYKEFAFTFYGPNVARLECETYGEYNDEGGTDYNVNEVRAFDFNSEDLGIDFYGDSFATWKAQEIERRRASAATGYSYYHKYPDQITNVGAGDFESAYEDARGNLPIADESEYSFTVDVTTPPVRPRIAIIED